MKTYKKIIVGISSLLLVGKLTQEIGHSTHSIDRSALDRGIIKLELDNPKKLKILISKDGKNYSYDYEKNSYYPLQMGNGSYSLDILEYVGNTRYKKIGREVINLQLKNPNSPYLEAISLIDWHGDMAAIKHAREITKNLKTKEEKLNKIYDFITKNIGYDFEKSNELSKSYRVNIDQVYKEKLGICYDYAILNAAMLRSLGLPTKLVMGYKSDISDYHAWNEVYINGKWEIVDTTYDSAYIQKNKKIKLFKNPKEYKVEKKY